MRLPKGGPYTFERVVVPEFAHNPDVRQLPDGSVRFSTDFPTDFPTDFGLNLFYFDAVHDDFDWWLAVKSVQL